jgi:hypothetical protein
MRRILGGASLAAVALLCLAPTQSVGQNQNNKNQQMTKSPPVPATPQDYAALMNLKQLPGTIYYLDTNGTKTLTLRVDIPQMVPNPNYKPPKVNMNTNRNMGNMNHHQQMAHLMQQHHQNSSKNPAQAQMHMMQMQMQMQQMAMQQMMQANMRAQQYQMQMMQAMAKAGPNGQPFKINVTSKDFELDMLDNVAVRKTFLGTEYDDMGNPKQYTKAQLAELKGKDTTKPGYTAKFEDVQPGQEVVVFLGKPSSKKSASASALEPKKVDEEKEKKADEEKKGDDEEKKVDAKKKKADAEEKPAAVDAAPMRTDRPVITMIVMTKELTQPLNNNAQAAGKKKKN